MKKLALDLGIASIGYAYIDSDTEKILETNTIVIPSNEIKGKTASQVRREKRSPRRINQRKGLRKQRLNVLFESLGLDKNVSISNEILNDFKNHLPNLKYSSENHAVWFLRKTAREDKISLEDLAKVIYHISDHRGYDYEVIETKTSKDETDYNKTKTFYEKTLSDNYFIADYMLDCFKDDKKI